MTQSQKPNFWNDNNGNLSIISGVVGLLLMTAVGAALDGSQMFSTKQRLQSITDAAALTATMRDGISPASREKLAVSSIYSHAEKVGGLNISSTTIDVNEAAGQVYVSLTADVPLLFGGVLGKNNRSVSASSLAEGSSSVSSLSNLSISLVLDVSSSMQDRFDTGSKIASVNAAVSDTFNMINAVYGGEAAASTRVSAGVYPFNWGHVDGETVSLEPGTDVVLNSVRYMPLSDGSMGASAMEMAVEDQLMAAKNAGGRNRYIVYITDGKTEEDKADQSGRFLDIGNLFEAKDTQSCKEKAEYLLGFDHELDGLLTTILPTGSALDLLTGGGTCSAVGMEGKCAGCNDKSHRHHPSYWNAKGFKQDKWDQQNASYDLTTPKHVGHTHASDTSLAKARRVEAREDYIQECRPAQPIRVAEACKKAREEGVSIIAVNLSGEDGVATNTVDMCVHGIGDGENAAGMEQAIENTSVSTTPSTRTFPSGMTVNLSADGQSFSADVTSLKELKEILASVMPEKSNSERYVRLVR